MQKEVEKADDGEKAIKRLFVAVAEVTSPLPANKRHDEKFRTRDGLDRLTFRFEGVINSS